MRHHRTVTAACTAAPHAVLPPPLLSGCTHTAATCPPALVLCAGPLVVKAGVWALVERMHKEGWGLTYEGRVTGLPAVSLTAGPVPCRAASLR